MRCGGCFDWKLGFKQQFFLLLVAKNRENAVDGAKNAGRWSGYAGGRPTQCILNGRLSMNEKQLPKAGGRLNRWSRFYCVPYIERQLR